MNTARIVKERIQKRKSFIKKMAQRGPQGKAMIIYKDACKTQYS